MVISDTQLKQEKAALSEQKGCLYEERKLLKSSIKVLEEAYALFATDGEKKRGKHLEWDRDEARVSGVPQILCK
jgi:hypothetical protein